jgi:NADH-quinone oxidoreductase subunit G
VLARPDLSARTSDIDHAGAVLVVETELVDEAPILDLRVRKAARRHGTKVVTLTSRPSALDPNSAAHVRFAPGAAEAALGALAAALGSPRASAGFDDGGHARAGCDPDALKAAADVLRDAGDVVILWGERASHGDRGEHAVDALLAVAEALGLTDREEAGLIEVPAATNGRGLREAGVLPNLGPGLSDPAEAGMSAAEMARALSSGELSALVLVNTDPLETHPERAVWEDALGQAGSLIAFSEFVTTGLAEHATVIFPVSSNAEKEGTLTHPDGRVQRVRQAIGRQGDIEPEWNVLAALADRCGAELDVSTAADVTGALAAAAPFLAGLDFEEIGGRGMRWQEREAASGLPDAELPDSPLEPPPALPTGLRLGAAPSLWTGGVTEHAPSLRFLSPDQRAELAPADAERLGVRAGDPVEVSAGGQRLRATVALRQAVQPGSVFLLTGTAEDNATALMNGLPRTVEVTRA